MKKVRRCVVFGRECYIPLPDGRTAVCDAEDYERVSKHNWSATNKNTIRAHIKISHGKYRDVALHRFILQDVTEEIDHINHDRLDNRKANLRVATRAQNCWNKRIKKDQKIEFKGVKQYFYKHKEKKELKGYVANLFCKGKNFYLGTFNTKEAAARAYDRKAIELFGEYAYLNFPREDYLNGPL